MASVGFHACHEQLPPSQLRRARDAEAAGFTRAMCADLFRRGAAGRASRGSAWSWLGTALEATGLPFGVVLAPGQRHHPAVIAQAGATRAELFPDRFWLALGSGEFSN